MDLKSKAARQAHGKQNRGAFFRRLLAYLLCACILTAVLAGTLYGFTAVHILSDRIAQEMMSRAVSISTLCTNLIDGKVVFDSFYRFLTSELRGARIHIYDAQGSPVLLTRVENETPADHSALVGAILRGEASAATDVAWTKGMIAVAVPILDNLSRVNGAVVLSKPSEEVRAAVSQLAAALLISVLVSAAVMLLPAYLWSQRVSKPLRRMTDVAAQMAAGDFSARAEIADRGEIGTLGTAFNHLSGALSASIEDLMLARGRLISILSGIGDGVIAFDASLETETYCNPAAERLLAESDSVARAALLTEEFRDLFVSAMESGEAHTAQKTVGESELQLTFSRSQSDSGSAPGVVVLLRDVTEAERLERTRRDYVANVSHELRTPIASIRSLAEALNDGMVHTEEDRARYYGYILRESLRLSRLIDDLLELSRLQSGAVALTRTPFDLNALLCRVADQMRLTASYSDIDLSYEPTPLPMCRSNRDRIEQVLIALLDNAIKYASDEGIIRLSARSQGDRITVEVRNSGHIDACDLPHLFDRFYQAERSHAGQGTGLGLAIVQEVLHRLDGTVEAHNEEGFAVFTFTIPCE